MESSLPWQGRAGVTVQSAQAAEGTLAFRLPGWCKDPVIRSAGKRAQVKDGYLYLTGEWKQGDTVEIDLPMHLRAMRADHRVRKDTGMTAVQYGPIVYCGEQCDNGPLLQNIRLDPARVCEGSFRVDEETFGRPIGRIAVPAGRVAPKDGALYSEWVPEETSDITL